ncbi:MAG: type II secretion system F family protein [Lachnospiraceae bacterium]|nr:type II secretion system F family protein [Lachnospiraceae bacterium]
MNDNTIAVENEIKKEKTAKMQKLSSDELYAFSDEMAMMLAGGVSSLEALTLLEEQAENKDEKALVSLLLDELARTSNLSKAIKATGAFPVYYESMVSIGEETGKLDNVFKGLADHYEREAGLKKTIRSAIGYPLLMTAMMVVIIVVMVTKIMPIFERVFEQLGSSMEGFSAGLLKAGKFMERYSLIFLGVLVLLLIVILCMSRKEAGRKALLNVFGKGKKMREIRRLISTSRFASGMAMTLSSGMDVANALDTASELVDDEELKGKTNACKEKFMETMDLGKSFSASGIFTGTYGRMAILAARTGHMEDAMGKVADTFEEEADDAIHGMIATVEPTLVIVLSVLVGLILLSVMLPLLSLMTGLM